MSDHAYSRLAVWGNAVLALVVTAGILWAANGFGPGFEALFRIAPTVEGGGVGTDWVAGNSVGWLNWLVAFVHLVDVVMGLFILLMVFIHWGAFRRLAARMVQPGTEREAGGAATDGGTPRAERSTGGDRE